MPPKMPPKRAPNKAPPPPGATSTTGPYVYPLSTLTQKDEELITREQFAPLNPEQQKWYDDCQASIDSMYDAWYAVPNTADDETDETEPGERDGEETLETIVDDVKACNMTWRDLGCIIDYKQEKGEGKLSPRGKKSPRTRKRKKMGTSGGGEAVVRNTPRHRKCFRKRPLDAYVSMICKYVNEIRGGDAEAKRLKAVKEWEQHKAAKEIEEANAMATDENEGSSSNSSGKRKIFSSEASEDEEEEPEPPSLIPVEITVNSPSCAMLTNQAFGRSTKAAGSRRAKEEFNKIGMTAEKFENLDFFFVPYVDREWGDSTSFKSSSLSQAHVYLIGIAPKQKFLFFIDSVQGSSYAPSANLKITQRLYAFLLTFIPNNDFSRDNQDFEEGQWRIYGEWSRREPGSAYEGTRDDSPDAPVQEDGYNCGIYAVTAAFCLAFGLKLCCYEQVGRGGEGKQELNALKKPRMAVELKAGDLKEFGYDMLELPMIWGRSGTRARGVGREPPRKGKGKARESGVRTRDSSGGKPLLDDDDERDDSDYEEDDSMIQEQIVSETEGSDGESDIETSNEALYTPAQLSEALATTPESHARKHGPPPKDKYPYPPQFDPKFHNEAGFLYAAPSFFNIQDRKYSKKEMKKVARDFKLKGWKEWSFEDQEIFQKWVFSQCGAVMARLRGDEVQPFTFGGIGVQET